MNFLTRNNSPRLLEQAGKNERGFPLKLYAEATLQKPARIGIELEGRKTVFRHRYRLLGG
jgi:hypothetical protein